MKLRDEIKQTKPFKNLEEEAFLNLVRTTDFLSRGGALLLKQFNLTAAQYNVLRILRGAGPEGLSCQECAARMVTREPDMTRLFDRLEARGLISRKRSTEDRRVVKTCITEPALALLAQIDQPLLELNKAQLSHLGEEKLKTLIELLELARSPRQQKKGV
jgi:DNA-binding MarR family transcriptional regulator